MTKGPDYTKSSAPKQNLEVAQDPDKRVGKASHKVDEVGLAASGTVMPEIKGDMNVTLGGLVQPHLGDALKKWFMTKLEQGKFQFAITHEKETDSSFVLITLRADRVGIVMAGEDHYLDFADQIQQMQREVEARNGR